MQKITAQQILVPKKVYIGDTAELRCTFKSSTKLSELHITGTELADIKDFAASKDYDIQSITLVPAGVDFYQFSITFVPWKTGEIVFPSYIITEADIEIIFQPVQIVSLISTDNTSLSNFRDIAAPLLLPGTTYKLYGGLTVFILSLIILIRIIVKRKSLLFYINTKKLQRKYKKNKKQTIKNLQKTLHEYESKNANHAVEAAEKLQHILRNYLEVRFDYPFTKAASSEIMPGFYKATGGLLSEKKTEAFGQIAASFVRTDYLRYKNGSAFKAGELAKLVENNISSIEILEQIEKKEEEKND